MPESVSEGSHPLGASGAGADRIVRSLVDACGDSLVAALLYGSRLTKTSPDRHSPFDMVLIVEDYRRFYRALEDVGHMRRSPFMMALLSRVLPPNSISHRPDSDTAGKCLVLELRHFRRAMSNRAKDHFCLGRLVQQVAIVYARDEDAAREVRRILDEGHRTPLRWAMPFLEAPFTVLEFARGMVAVSYAAEIRPEQGGRPQEVIDAQAEFFEGTFGPILEEATRSGLLVEEAGAYRPRRPPTWWSRARLRLYFFSSRVRSTARWVKHVYTFEGWEEYIVRKVERRMGVSVELTPLERRFPVILLWPKVIRVLGSKSVHRRHGSNESEDE